jgi:site-specific DNA-methyltransferase (adenine-specific)
MIVKDSKPFIKELLKKRQKELGLSSKEINERLGVKSNGGGMWSIYTGENVCEQVPTLELWLKLQEVLSFEYPYEKLAQTFNPQMGFTDVWRDIDFYSEQRFHKTQKPIKLIRRLIDASSNEGDLILDPFAGSGSTAISAEMAKRNYITFDASEEYIKVVKERVESITNPLKTLISV